MNSARRRIPCFRACLVLCESVMFRDLYVATASYDTWNLYSVSVSAKTSLNKHFTGSPSMPSLVKSASNAGVHCTSTIRDLVWGVLAAGIHSLS